MAADNLQNYEIDTGLNDLLSHIPASNTELETKRQETGAKATEAALDVNESLKNLSGVKKLAALAGFSSEGSISKIPESITLFTVQGSAEVIALAAKLSENYAIPAQPLILSSANGVTSQTITFATADPANVAILSDKLRECGTVGSTLTIMAGEIEGMILGDSLITTKPVLNRHAAIINPKGVSTYKASTKGTETGVTTTETEPKPFSPEAASNESIVFASQMAEKREIQGPANFLALNLQRLTPAEITAATEVIKTVSQSENFVITNNKGYIVILNFSERGGSAIGRLAQGIYKATAGKAAITIGSTKTETRGTYQETEPNIHVLEAGHPGIKMSADYAKRLKETRESTLYEFKTRTEKDNDDIHTLTGVTPRAKLHIGGPDKLIGREPELRFIQNFLRGEEKLLTVTGQAGIGKSRLIAEAIGEATQTLTLTLDPSGENKLGSSLITISEQIYQQLLETSPPKEREHLENLRTFCSGNDAEKLAIAQTSPQTIVAQLLQTIDAHTKKHGAFALVLDDLHHADRHSDGHLMDFVREFLSASRRNKAILSMRPEERFESAAQKDLERKMQGEKMEMKLLNFDDAVNAYNYALHSFPPEVREGKTLKGGWYKKLAAKANGLPLYLTAMLNEIVEDPTKYNIIDNRYIEVDDSVIDNLKIGNEADLELTFREKIRRLPEETQKFLAKIAMIGNSLTMEQLAKLGGKECQGHLKALKAAKIISLQANGPNGDITGIAITFDGLKDVAIGQLKVAEHKNLAASVYNTFRSDESIHPDTKLSWLQEGTGIGLKDKTFWGLYAAEARKAQTDARNQAKYGRILKLAEMVTGGKTIQAALEKEKTPAMPEEIRQMIVDSLIDVAETAAYLGKGPEVDKAVALLEKLHAENPAGIDLNRALNASFRYKYIHLSESPRELGPALGTIQTKKAALGIVPQSAEKQAEEVLLNLMALYQGNNMEGFKQTIRDNINIFSTLPPNHPARFELTRLANRASIENLRSKLGSDVDGDILLSPNFLDENQKKMVERIDGDNAKIIGQNKANPGTLNPFAEMSLMEMHAQTKAFLGQYREATDAMNEAWRQAYQVGMPIQQARAAKLKGDIEILEAVTTKQPDGKLGIRPHISTAAIMKAIATFKNQGLTACEKLPKTNFMNLNIQAEIMRAASIAIANRSTSPEGKTDAQMEILRRDLGPVVIEGLKAIGAVETDLDPKLKGYLADPGLMYYYQPYAQLIEKAAIDLDLNITYTASVARMPNEKLKEQAANYKNTDPLNQWEAGIKAKGLEL